MVIDYEGYTYDLNGGKAGIHHRVGSFVDPATFSTTGGEEFRGVKVVAWVTEEVSHCTICRRDNVIPGELCFGTAPVTDHRIIVLERKREVEIWLTYDEAFKLGLGLMKDFSLGRYGVG